jgi:hypothetical protein
VFVKRSGSEVSHATDGDPPDRDESPPHQTGGQMMSVDTRSTHWDAILNDVSAA